MPDSRPSGLSEVLAAELASLYDSLVIPVDDPSYSAGDVKKIKAKTLLKSLTDAVADNGTAISGINNRLTTTPTNDSMATAIENGTELLTGVFITNTTNAFGSSIYAYKRNNVVCINGYFNSRGGDGSSSSPLEMAYSGVGTINPPKEMYFVASLNHDRQIPCLLKIVGNMLSIGVLGATEPGSYAFNLTYVV